MGQNSKIEWTDHTFNPWWGCTKVSAGCANCYAESFANRFGNWWGPDAERRFFGTRHWNDPLRWNRKAERAGVQARVFCGSMCDFLEDRDDLQDAREALYELIDQTPMLDWLLLTKRPENFHLLPEDWYEDWPGNVWPGVTVENSDCLWRVDKLLLLPAAVRFVSCEPLLSEVDLDAYLPWCERCQLPYGKLPCDLCPDNPEERSYIDWVIVGGESGPSARPMHPSWAQSLRDQCQTAGVPYFFKQWGEWRWYDGPLIPALYSHGTGFYKVGKKFSGRFLDGRTWDEIPQVGGNQ